MRGPDRPDLKGSDVDSPGRERAEVIHIGQIFGRPLGLVRTVRGDEPAGGLARRVHREPVRPRIPGRRGMVAAQHGQRGEVRTVIRVQMGEHQRVQVKRIPDGHQHGKGAVTELESQQETLRLQ
jgi:hypothetical protein